MNIRSLRKPILGLILGLFIAVPSQRTEGATRPEVVLQGLTQTMRVQPSRTAFVVSLLSADTPHAQMLRQFSNLPSFELQTYVLRSTPARSLGRLIREFLGYDYYSSRRVADRLHAVPLFNFYQPSTSDVLTTLRQKKDRATRFNVLLFWVRSVSEGISPYLTPHFDESPNVNLTGSPFLSWRAQKRFAELVELLRNEFDECFLHEQEIAARDISRLEMFVAALRGGARPTPKDQPKPPITIWVDRENRVCLPNTPGAIQLQSPPETPFVLRPDGDYFSWQLQHGYLQSLDTGHFGVQPSEQNLLGAHIVGHINSEQMRVISEFIRTLPIGSLGSFHRASTLRDEDRQHALSRAEAARLLQLFDPRSRLNINGRGIQALRGSQYRRPLEKLRYWMKRRETRLGLDLR